MAKSKDFQEVVGSVPKGDNEIRVTAGATKSGEPYIDLRLFVDSNREFIPTPKGVRFHAEVTDKLVDLIKAGLELVDERLAVKSK